MRLLRTFLTSDAVEGALEVRMELYEALHGYRGRIRLTLLVVLVGAVLAIGTSAIQGVYVIQALYEQLIEELSVNLWPLVAFFAYGVLTVLGLALGSSALLFLWQIRRYLRLLRARYGTLEGPTPVRPRVSKKRSWMRRRSEVEKEEDEVEAARDPASVLLGLAREAEGEVDQLGRLLLYSIAFTLMLAGVMFAEFAMTAVGLHELPDVLVPWMLVIQGLTFVMLLAAMALFTEAQRFLAYFTARVAALEAFEAMGPVPLPSGPSVLGRYRQCITATAALDEGQRELMGMSGEARVFDLVLGDVGERVLVRTFPGVPDVEQLEDLRRAAEDVARSEGELPARVVALVDAEIEDLDVDDEVYEYLMGIHILDERGERARSLQIVAEVEGYYTVLPFTSP